MWDILPTEQREEYKKMILAFASLTEIFAQKSSSYENENKFLSPAINSKYQETIFQRIFNASAEDINNTSFDVALTCKDVKYLIGIKTFCINSNFQKIAQFKANSSDWTEIINKIKLNSLNENKKLRDQNEINNLNLELYKELAVKISKLRNIRMRSSEANIQGFSVLDSSNRDNVRAVYHVLMSSRKNEEPFIYVGEMNYDEININNISVIGCTGAHTATNFEFTDGINKYKYTSADSQLFMYFDNENIIKEKWKVNYVDDAYKIFHEIANKINLRNNNINKFESYSWLITNSDGEVELFSGFNSFYGVGSKIKFDDRQKRINEIKNNFTGIINENILNDVIKKLNSFLLERAYNYAGRLKKVEIRKCIINELNVSNNQEFKDAVLKLIFRPKDEIYIPIPDSRNFHEQHPDFFGKDKNFTLVFEPSGKELRAFITQDYGKAIESYERQKYLGEWILRKVFQLRDYEPLTSERLKEIGVNGIRLEKDSGGRIHLYFIWINLDDLPEDYIKKI